MAEATRKLTTLIGGQIDASLKGSVGQAEQQLARLRKEQRADVREAQRLTQSLKQLEKGTVSYNRAQGQLAKLKSGIGERENQIAGLNMQVRSGVGITGQLSQKVSGLAKSFGKAGKVGLAIGAVIGIIAGGIAIVNKLRNAVNSYIKQVVRLENLQARGFDPEGVQRLTSGFRALFYDATAATNAVNNITGNVQDLRAAWAWDPSTISRDVLRALGEVGGSVSDLTGDVVKDFATIGKWGKRVFQERGIDYFRGWAKALNLGEAETDALLRLYQNSDDVLSFNAALNEQVEIMESQRAEAKRMAEEQDKVNRIMERLKATLVLQLAPAFTSLYKAVEPYLKQATEWLRKSENMEKVNRGIAVSVEAIAFGFKAAGIYVKKLIGLIEITAGVVEVVGNAIVGVFSATLAAVLRLVNDTVDAYNAVARTVKIPTIDTSGLKKARADLDDFNKARGDAIIAGGKRIGSGAKKYGESYVDEFNLLNEYSKKGVGQRADERIAAQKASSAQAASETKLETNLTFNGITDTTEITKIVAERQEDMIVRSTLGYK